MARLDPAALEQWMQSLPPAALQQLQTRLAAIAAGMPAVWQLAVARAAASTGRGPSFPLPQADLGDFDFGAMSLALASAGAQVGTAIFANHAQNQLSSEMTASANASNSALAQAEASAKTAVAAALAAAKQQSAAPSVTTGSTHASGTKPVPSTTSTSTLVIWGLGGLIGLLALSTLLRK